VNEIEWRALRARLGMALPVTITVNAIQPRGLSSALIYLRDGRPIPCECQPPTSGYWASAAFRSADFSRFASSGVSLGGSTLIVSVSILPVNLNGTW
jgi:hypothetical protein